MRVVVSVCGIDSRCSGASGVIRVIVGVFLGMGWGVWSGVLC